MNTLPPNKEETYFPPLEPYATGFLKVSDIHTLYYEESGNPKGVPIVFLHGGPGLASDPEKRRQCDPAVYRIIQFDQRGCGQSTPVGELAENTTAHLVDDIEALRKHLQVDVWHVVGRSWGSTLALVYAIAHPQRVLSLILGGVFLGTKKEVAWVHGEGGASRYFPDMFERMCDVLTPHERTDIVGSFLARIQAAPTLPEKIEAASQALSFEGPICAMAYNRLNKKMEKEALKAAGDMPEEVDEDLSFLVPLALLELHYTAHALFIEEGYILAHLDKIAHIPTTLVQGRYDVVCPPQAAWDVHQAHTNSHLVIVPAAGHSGSESLREMMAALAAHSRIQHLGEAVPC